MPTAMIVGASRGLGLGLAREFADRGWDVIATARDLDAAEALNALAAPTQTPKPTDADLSSAAEAEDAVTAPKRGRVTLRKLDIENAADAYALSRRFDEPLDVLFVNAGISGPRGRDVTSYTDEDVQHVFLTNAVAPVRLAKMLLKSIDPERGVVAFMTSMMGSQALNTSGGAEIYRASKAALNSFAQSFVAELGGKGPTVLTLHPGWVKTDMGGQNAPLDVDTSVRGLVDVVLAAQGGREHGFKDYKGDTLPW